MTNRVGVTAIVTFPVENHDNALSLFQKHLPMLRSYNGCERFVVYRDLENSGVFTINEEWNTRNHLNIHLEDKAIIAIFSEIEALQGTIKNIFTQDISAL